MGIQKLEPSLGGMVGGRTWSKRQLLRKWSSREPMHNKKGPCPSTPMHPTWAAEQEPVCQVEERMGVMLSWRKEGRAVSPTGTASPGCGKPRKGGELVPGSSCPPCPMGTMAGQGEKRCLQAILLPAGPLQSSAQRAPEHGGRWSGLILAHLCLNSQCPPALM